MHHLHSNTHCGFRLCMTSSSLLANLFVVVRGTRMEIRYIEFAVNMLLTRSYPSLSIARICCIACHWLIGWKPKDPFLSWRWMSRARNSALYLYGPGKWEWWEWKDDTSGSSSSRYAWQACSYQTRDRSLIWCEEDIGIKHSWTQDLRRW